MNLVRRAAHVARTAPARLAARRDRPTGLVGYFRWSHGRLNGIKWANWGSRPYEYQWAARTVDVAGKDVLDLGVGLPSDYNWFRYVQRTLRPRRYCGVDHDPRILSEEIDEPGLQIRRMDMTALEFDDASFDAAYCLSVLEHLHVDAFARQSRRRTESFDLAGCSP